MWHVGKAKPWELGEKSHMQALNDLLPRSVPAPASFHNRWHGHSPRCWGVEEARRSNVEGRGTVKQGGHCRRKCNREAALSAKRVTNPAGRLRLRCTTFILAGPPGMSPGREPAGALYLPAPGGRWKPSGHAARLHRVRPRAARRWSRPRQSRWSFSKRDRPAEPFGRTEELRWGGGGGGGFRKMVPRSVRAPRPWKPGRPCR